jgi:hypothetical protein
MLRFGPYRMPRYKIGGKLDCRYAGTIRIVAIGDAPQQWPLGVVTGHWIPVLCGSLIRAVRNESAGDIAAAWGVGVNFVTAWRKVLGVKTTKGERLRRSEKIKASDPGRSRKIAAARLGKPMPASVRRALRKANAGRPLTPKQRAKMSAAHKRRGTTPPAAGKPWAAWEDRLLYTLPPSAVASKTARTLAAVYMRRAALGINDGRTTRRR